MKIIDQGRDRSYVACPVCGFENTHPTRVVVSPVGGVVAVDISRNDIRTYPKGPEGRGVIIELHFTGECFHRWTTRLKFYKGMTFVVTEATELEMSEGEAPTFDTIWRD